jgi:hypothetical protein
MHLDYRKFLLYMHLPYMRRLYIHLSYMCTSVYTYIQTMHIWTMTSVNTHIRTMHIWKLATSIKASSIYAPFVYACFCICTYMNDAYTDDTDDAYMDEKFRKCTYMDVGHFHNGIFFICAISYMRI